MKPNFHSNRLCFSYLELRYQTLIKNVNCYSESSCIVLDCGEATYGQIVRLYGESRSEIILKNLRAIYISHLHADHHIGLIGLLRARLRLFETSEPQTLYLLAPQQIRTWLNTYHHHFEPILQNLQLIPNGKMVRSNKNISISVVFLDFS